ncbi:Protein snail [Taenia solium]|eukprot:TsM_001092000 transcript=TsM_001092000 gene=TsM_001092000
MSFDHAIYKVRLSHCSSSDALPTMKYDFSIASILELPPTAQAVPKSSCFDVKDKDNCSSRVRQSDSFEFSSILSSPSTTTMVNSSSPSSTSIDKVDPSSSSQFECGSSKQSLSKDSLTHPSSQPVSSTSLHSTSQMETFLLPSTSPANFDTSIASHLPQCSHPQLPSKLGLQTSDYLSLRHYVLSRILFNTVNKFITESGANFTDNDANFSTIEVRKHTNNDEREDNGRKNNSIGFSTITNEVNDAGLRGEERPKWKCEECGKTYKIAVSLRTHKQSHSRSWKCSICGKAFTRKWLLQGHRRTHTGEKPFVCPTCHWAFADRSNLQAHMQVHMEVKNWRCTHCPASFTRRGLLTRHLEKCSSSPFSTAAVMNDVSTTSTTNTAYDVDASNRIA